MRDDRDAILDGVLRLLGRRPDASMAELAAAGGISRATLHRRYPRREDLVGALVRRALTEVEQAFARAQAAGEGPVLARLVRELLPVAYDFGFLARVPDAEITDAEATWAELDSRLTRLAGDAQERGELRRDMPPAWVATALISLLSGAADAVGSGALAPRDVERLVLATLTEGLAGTQR